MPTGNDDVVLFHMPKTGGTWAATLVVNKHDWRDGGRHTPARRIGRNITGGRSRIAMIRDPWTWYGSWWRHCMQSRQDALMAWSGGPVDFYNVLFGATHIEGERMPSLFGRECVHPGIIGDPLHEDDMPHSVPVGSSDSDLGTPRIYHGGLYTWFVRHYLKHDDGTWAVDLLLDHAQSYRAASNVFGREITPETDPPIQTSRFTVPVEWNDEMIRWVWEADGELARLFGYDGPDTQARSAVMKTAEL